MGTAGAMITAFLASAGLGAVIGLERQTHHRDDEDVYAGARTFALFSLWGATTGVLSDEFGSAAFVVSMVALTVLLTASYYFASKLTGDWGITTELAALITFAVGALVWAEYLVPAVALTVGTIALLSSKDALHELGRKFSDEDVRSAVQFGVITAVVLPLLPDEAYGPFQAFNPREIWLMVVLVTAVGLAGYVALRVKGVSGLLFTGFVGGLISSTAVTLGFSRMAKQHSALVKSLAAGITGACGLMFIRVLILAFIIAPSMGEVLALPMVALFLAVTGGALWWARTAGSPGSEDAIALKNPLSLATALQFGALYAVVVFVSKALLDRFSAAALNVVGALSGINDVDAINLSTANLVVDGLDATAGAKVVLIAVAVNTLVKAGLVVTLGGRRLGRSAGLLLGAAGTASFAVWLLL